MKSKESTCHFNSYNHVLQVCFLFLPPLTCDPSAVINKTYSDFLSPPDHLLPHYVSTALDQRSNSPIAFLFFSLTLVYSTITLLLNTHLHASSAQCLSTPHLNCLPSCSQFPPEHWERQCSFAY